MDTYTVEFRIEGSTLVPSNVSKVLELDPCQTREKAANKNGKRYRTPFWSFDAISTEENYVEKEWELLEEGLLFLLSKLLPKRDLIHSNFGEYKLYLWCGYFKESFDGGPTFSPDLLAKLAEFGTELILRTYQHDD